jgi:hypothetical protein
MIEGAHVLMFALGVATGGGAVFLALLYQIERF